MQPNTPHDVVIQSWRGQDSLAEAARRGYRGILSAGYYINLNQSAADHYAVDPFANGKVPLSPEQASRILGGEATMWTEFATPENISSRIWPRTAAIAERLWSAQNVNNIDSMYQRLGILSQKLAIYDLSYRSNETQMLNRLADYKDSTALTVLASVVQPPRDYAREDLKSYDAFSPLNRLVDTVPPESNRAREFKEIATRITKGTASPRDWQTARYWLTLWRDNDVALKPILANSDLTIELAPLSHNVSETAMIGLLALDALENHLPEAPETIEQQVVELKELEKPQAVLLNMVVPGVKILLEKPGPQ